MIHIDRNFHERIQLRKEIISDFPASAVHASKACKPAIDEIYTFLVTHYLPIRFPNIFRIVSTNICTKLLPSNQLEGSGLLNTITGVTYSLQPSPSCAKTTLKSLATLVDEDFMFLLPSPDGDGYSLQGYLMCFSSGFSSAEGGNMLGTKLRDLHGEVPGYKEKLESKMDRWISKLKAGRYWKRANVSNSFEKNDDHLVGDESRLMRCSCW